MKIIIAIDPGKSGGLVRQSDGSPVLVAPMPETEGDIVDILREWIVDPANKTLFD